jgi:serine/threonine-protein kinase
MTPDRWQNLKTLFDAALKLPPAEREKFLSSACANDEGLRRELDDLLASHASAESFIESPAAEKLASYIANMHPSQAMGQRVGHYEVVGSLGLGGMGEVYLAQDTKLKRKVALKLLPSGLSDDKERLKRFEQEALATSALNHPNILTIHEIGEHSGIKFIATEFIDGVTWRERMKQECSLLELLEIAIQVASALASAHEAGIIHRDIKPENIMMRRDGIVKVLDFGLAKLARETEIGPADSTRQLIRTGAGIVMGTTSYMSPEQARGKAIDVRTDIWSFGVVLYEALSGRKPFPGETPSDVIANILMTEPPPLKQVAPATPDELVRIIGKTMRPDRNQRYQNGRELLSDLKHLKQELEFAAKSQRTLTIDPSEAGPDPLSQMSPAHSSSTTEQTPIAPTSSAEYIHSQLKQHKVGILLIAALLFIGVGTVGYLLMRNVARPEQTVTSAIDSLAVLPLANSSRDPNAEYLSDGITESLINTLSQLPGVRVLSRSAAFRYKGKEVDAQTAGHELNVRAVLKGAVKQLGDQLIINVELIDVLDNRQIWGEQYVRKFSDVLAIQRDIVQEVAGKLRLRLTDDEQQRLSKRTTDNPDAYRLYLRGRYHAATLSKQGFDTGIDLLYQAVALDPTYALAYEGLAFYYYTSVDLILPPNEAMPKAKAAAEKAISLDDSLAEAHSDLGMIHFQFDYDAQAAERQLKRAIEVNPNSSLAHQNYGWFLIFMGRTDESLVQMRLAQKLDPLSLEISTNTAATYYFAHHYDQSIEASRRIVQTEPHFWLGHALLGRAYEQKGQLGEAIAEYQRARELDPEIPESLMDLGRAYGKAGRRREAEQVLAELQSRAKKGYVAPFQVAMVYVGLGDKDQAFAWLEKALAARSWYMTWLRVAPELDPLRSDPRYQDLLQRIQPAK